MKAPSFEGTDDGARRSHNLVFGRRLSIPPGSELGDLDSDQLSEKKDEDEDLGSGSDNDGGGGSKKSSSSSSSSSSDTSSSSSSSSTSTSKNGTSKQMPPSHSATASTSGIPASNEPGPSDSMASVKARLLEQMEAGQLPRTTETQRSRQRLTHGTRYRVPAALKEALRLGFINPNLPAPRGMQWERIQDGFRLTPRGG